MARYCQIFGLIALVFSSCYKPKEGCIDAFAQNFDPTADVACDGCCQLPSLILQVRHLLADTNFSTAPVLYDVLDTPFLLTQVQFYIYDIELLAADGTIFQVSDSIDLPNTGKKLLNDMQLVTNGQFSYPIGAISATKTLVGFRFKVGLPNDVQSTEPADWPAQHPLSSNSLYDQTGGQYQTGSVSFNRFDSETQTIVWHIDTPHQVALLFDQPFELPVGFAVNLLFELQHGFWLFDADITNDNAATLQLKLQNNLPLVFEG